jgi:hypothetical protein
MSRAPGCRAPGVGGAAVLLAATVALALAGCQRETAPPPPRAVSTKVEAGVATLLFPAADGKLHAEPRPLQLPVEADRRVEAVIGALLGGPKSSELAPVLPPGVTLTDCYVDRNGVAYLDLGSKELPDPPPSGSDLELLRIYALVDTVTGNEPRVRSVVLLWNGAQRATFAGHVDTTRPLLPDSRWLQR